MIYFISSGFDGLIKIGTAENPDRRLKELQTGSGDRLFLLVAIDGNQKDEAALHRVFSQFRVRGEWFDRQPVLGYLKAVLGLELPTTALGYDWPGSGDCCPVCGFDEVYWPERIVEDADGLVFGYKCRSDHDWTTWFSPSFARYGMEVFG